MAVLQGADILLPADTVDVKKWAVIACDQFTSQPKYWNQVESFVGDEWSTLHMIYPEVYLSTDNGTVYKERIRKIQNYMENCLKDGILAERIHQGYVLTVRETDAGTRVGLLAALDLEAYDYSRNAKSRVRATEATVQARIPVRVGIREGAPVEIPHVMMLLDDIQCRLIEPLYDRRDTLPKLYNTDLMMGGGRVSGYAVEGAEAEELTSVLEEMEKENDGIFLAVGDGNHSLAAAKACWEEVKKSLTEEECINHSARYALVEVVNIHSPALAFYPIHRIVFGGNREAVAGDFCEWLQSCGICWNETREASEADVTFVQKEWAYHLRLTDTKGRLAVEILQGFLDEYLRAHSELCLDYVHDEQAVVKLSEEQSACGILLRAVDKRILFSAIAAGGVLPRKTFSIGEDYQKRYYMECRRLS